MYTDTPYNESRLLIRGYKYLNESSLYTDIFLMQYIEWDALFRIDFVTCTFERILLIRKTFGSCTFNNCIFNNFDFKKSKFSNCHFKNCIIINCDMKKTKFNDIYFEECEFLGVDLESSNFYNCKLKRTKFLKNKLNFMIVKNIKIWKPKKWKIWKSEKWIKIKDFSDFLKHLNE